MTEIQNRRKNYRDLITYPECFGNWIFGFGYYLEFVAWDLKFLNLIKPFDPSDV